MPRKLPYLHIDIASYISICKGDPIIDWVCIATGLLARATNGTNGLVRPDTPLDLHPPLRTRIIARAGAWADAKNWNLRLTNLILCVGGVLTDMTVAKTTAKRKETIRAKSFFAPSRVSA